MRKQHILFLGVFLALLPVLALRDYTPDNELKYLSIAEESIRDGNIFAFYNHGEPYADKPPLYLWIVTLGRLIFGKHVMFFLSLFSLIPAFITVGVMNKWVRKERHCDETMNSIMLLSSAFFLACAIVLRMDMLMTMFITLALYTFYRMYRFNNKGMGAKILYRRWSILLPVYTFLAIFTKGAVGIMVPLMSIAVFLALNRKIKTIGKYIGWKFWGILAGLCALWFTGVFLDGGTEYLNNLLFNQTINRAVNSFHHKEPFWYYFVTYWYAIAPWSIVTVTAIIIGFRRGLINNDLLRMFAVVSIGTILMMSCISSKIVVYLLPAFPCLVYLGAILIGEIGKSRWLNAAVAIPAAIFVILQGAAIYADKSGLVPVDLGTPVYYYTLILCAGGVAALYHIWNGNLPRAITVTGVSMFVFILAAGLSMDKLNDMVGLKNATDYAKDEMKGLEQNYGQQPRIMYYDFRSGDNLDVYFGHPVDELAKEDLQEAENLVLVVKERRFRRDSALNAALGEYPRKLYGEFAIVTVGPKE